ncbi:uncharacterized protein LOC106662670 isoform X3 [Cimex lectularius]|uniref:Tetraspanin n=1 Tax=Cimex lectularius TaxID=79782 RepID=A0A8I6RFR1_CIMLE|nr:uncharacterized protein LOC106662670 isoform X3 [Cimex lectularius]
MRLNPFRQADFLYFYSLQAGVVICSSIGIFLAITSLIVNLASENSEIENNIIVGHYFLIVVYGTFSLLGHMLGLMSGYKESRKLALAAAVIQSLMFLYWLAFLGVSYLGIKAITRRVCIDNRCPDHLWIQDSRWRPFSGVCDPADLTLPQLSKTKGQAASLIIKASNSSSNGLNIIGEYDLTMRKTKSEERKSPIDEKQGILIGLPSRMNLVGVQERLWVPQTGMGKAAYIAGSIILSIIIAWRSL